MFDPAGSSTVDMNAIDFASEALNQWGRSWHFFDVQRYLTAVLRGSFSSLAAGSEAELAGQLTTEVPTCMTSRSPRRTNCRTEAWGDISRDEFGIDAGKAFGLSMEVEFRIRITAIEAAHE